MSQGNPSIDMEFECTQITPDDLNVTLSQDVENNVIRSDKSSEIWGLLVRKNGETDIELLFRVHRERGDCSYLFGRSVECDIVIPDRRISSKHCLLYCNYKMGKLCVYIEDIGVNGTYVNNIHTKISKGERLEIKSGDEIFLVNPRTVRKDGTSNAVFMFVNMQDKLTANRDVKPAPERIRNSSDQTQLTFSSNQNELVLFEHQRNIEDYYVIGEHLGSGVSGAVHLCVQRTTGKHYVSSHIVHCSLKNEKSTLYSIIFIAS
jgi:hypothetical protein